MPIQTINAPKPKAAPKKKAIKIKDEDEFIVVDSQAGMKLLHHWTDDEQRTQTTEISGVCTAADLRSVKVDIEEWIERGMIEPIKADSAHG